MSRTSQRSTYRVLAGIAIPLYRLVAKISWRGTENFPATGGFVVAANHLTEIDPITVAYPVYKSGIMPRFLAKESLFRVPVLGRLLTHIGMVPVYRGTARAKDSLEAAFVELNDGGAILVYPEGTVTRDPRMWPMRAHTGAARLSLQGQVPVVPMAHWGDQNVLYRDPQGKRTFNLFPPKKVRVLIGEPLQPQDLMRPGQHTTDHPTADDLNYATTVIMDRITNLLSELRGEQAPSDRFDPRARKESR
ncbi:lysophospholipid acyltransferase family protein [Kocuria carniphila]|uniref:lysophospholipid acyltransferase family protein n=1 Tax=Kocuria carniphila TaxID=262208 RepID=UPI0034CFC95F